MPLPAAQEKRKSLKDFLACVSLASLCFLTNWYDLEILTDSWLNYYRVKPPTSNLPVALLLAGLVLGTIFWLGWRLAQRSRNPLARRVAGVVFLAVLLDPLETVRQLWTDQHFRFQAVATAAVVMTELTICAGIVLVVWRNNMRIVRVCRRMVMLMTLFFVVLMADFALKRLAGPSASEFGPRRLAESLPASLRKPTRLVWLLFDELDQQIVFANRPPSIDLPEIDRLRAGALSADHVLQAGGWTMVAMPAMMSGRPFAAPTGPPNFLGHMDLHDLYVTLGDSGTTLSWHSQPHLFAEARQLGINSAVVGWYHPYCRLLGDSLTSCYSEPSGHASGSLLREFRADEQGLFVTMLSLIVFQVATLQDLLPSQGTHHTDRWNESFLQWRQARRYFTIRQRTLGIIGSPDINFLFVHWPTPHSPGIYDRRRQDFTLSRSLDYLDNLALVDRTLGEIRRKLEAEGLWDSTTLLVTSDHGFRPQVWGQQGWTEESPANRQPGANTLTPVLLKLAGQRKGAVYPQPFRATLLHDLILAILGGDIGTPVQTIRWLDEHRAAHPAIGVSAEAQPSTTARSPSHPSP